MPDDYLKPRPDPLAAYFSPAAKILLVENDFKTANELDGILEGAGYVVELATSGEQALLVAVDFLADLVLIDTALTDRNSADVAQTLRTVPRLAVHYRNAKFLYLVDRELVVSRRFSQHPETPVSSLVFKPVEADNLLGRVRRALEASPLPSS